MSSCFSISRRLVVKLFTRRSDLKGFDHNLKNATVKEYLCGMREVYNENKPIVLAENSNETDLLFKSAVMKKKRILQSQCIWVWIIVGLFAKYWILCEHSIHCVTL